jgi:WD40 repeat protein
MNTRHCAYYPHFQLRNVMAATSRNDIYYATKEGVLRTDASGSSLVPVIDLRKRTVNGNPCQITTLAASNNVLIAGGFEGDYYMANLASPDDPDFITGMIRDWAPDTKSYLTNHLHLFNSRSSYNPQAVFCSNDGGLRVLDCATDTFQYSFSFPFAVNCSDTSPDGRLRVVVGDFQETLITNAETGEPLATLKAHTDDAFACAWADDGIHVASAAQDSTIAIWDARYWSEPVAMIPSELSVPRALRFSPVGSGPRVLIAAEADDYINIINAQTFESKQVFDFFGPTAGISMTPDGQSLFVANAEKRFGGIIELERAGWGEDGGSRLPNGPYGENEWSKWDSDDGLDHDRRVPCGFGQRDRRGLDLGGLVV